MAQQTTSPTSATSSLDGRGFAHLLGGRGCQPASHVLSRADGFTLIELLVVIGILILLVGILIPVLSRANKSAQRTKTAADLAMIGFALEAYHSDFGDYPRFQPADALWSTSNSADRPIPETSPPGSAPSYPMTGAQLLCQALLGLVPMTELPDPGTSVRHREDGADGAGFKTPRRMTSGPDGIPNNADDVVAGPVHGPYVQADKIRLGNPDNPAVTDPNVAALQLTLLDSVGNPILYFPAGSKKTSPTNLYAEDSPFFPAAVTPEPVYNFRHNAPVKSITPLNTLKCFQHLTSDGASTRAERMQAMLGDTGNTRGKIDGTETAAMTTPYILWSAGADGQFGPETADAQGVKSCDDILSPQP